MKKLTVLFVVLALILTFSPALAGRNAPVGARIGLNAGSPQTFPPDTPFYIGHGWQWMEPQEQMSPRGLMGFTLDMDGVPLPGGFLWIQTLPQGNPQVQTWMWVYNFPNGLTGTHTFTGHWYEPCALSGLDCGKNPAAPVEVNTKTITVNFGP